MSLNYDPDGVSAIANWMRNAEADVTRCLSRGGVFCVELRDRSAARDCLTDARVRAIWSRVKDEFGGMPGLGFLGTQRAFAVTDDESHWASLAATVVEAAIANGVQAQDIGVGVGFARMEQRGQPTADILRLATSAASHASDAGIGFASRSLAEEERMRRASLIRQSLTAALCGKEGLRLIFQPKVDAVSSAVMGAEALLRFDCPEFGAIPTMELLDIAEASGELESLDRWALGLAVEALHGLCAQGHDALPISVNIRGETAFKRGFVEFVSSTLTTFGVAPSLLRIEIREADAMGDVERAAVCTQALSLIGVTTALDGFGSSSSTLPELSKFNVQALKLDPVVVREMMVDSKFAQLAQGMLHLARVLQMETVAVGIETEEQREYMRDAGCTSLQGFLFYRPMELDELLRLVQNGESQAPYLAK